MNTTICEWMIEKGIASHGIAAGHIKAGLQLEGLPRAEQEARCLLYRSWRPKTDRKNQIPTWQAFELSIAGIDPADVAVRQMGLMEHTCKDCGASLPTPESEMEHGGNCPAMEQEPPNMVQVSRDMAIDAGDRDLEGQWIQW